MAGVGAAVLLAGCGSSDSLPKTPTLTAARACLQRRGMSSTLVTSAKLRAITLSSSGVATPITELSVLHSGAPRTRLLIAYFATTKDATAAQQAVNSSAPAFRHVPAGGFELQQAADGKQRGRVLVIEFHAVADDQNILFAARYCTTGVPIPKTGSSGG